MEEMSICDYNRKISQMILELEKNKNRIESIIAFAVCFALLKKLKKERDLLLDKEILNLK